MGQNSIPMGRRKTRWLARLMTALAGGKRARGTRAKGINKQHTTYDVQGIKKR